VCDTGNAAAQQHGVQQHFEMWSENPFAAPFPICIGSVNAATIELTSLTLRPRRAGALTGSWARKLALARHGSLPWRRSGHLARSLSRVLPGHLAEPAD
jgi:hypothetical protein